MPYSFFFSPSMTHRRPFPSLPFSFSSLSLGPAVAVGAENGGEGEGEEDEEEGMWGRMLPEIMTEIISRVEASEERWPSRKDVVACGGVCRRWRDITLGIVNATCEGGSRITFPSSLRQPGPRDPPFQCFIKRNKKIATFYLYLSLNQTLMDPGKFLLAARRSRRGAYIEYIMSLDPEDLSQGSNAYMGKLRSDFLGTNYTIYDSQPPFNGAKASNNRASRRFACKQISPQVPAGNFVTGQVSYKFNILKSKGPRRMKCVLQCPSLPSTKNSDEDASVKTSPKSSSVKQDQLFLRTKLRDGTSTCSAGA